MRTTTAVQVSCHSRSSTRVLPTMRRRTSTTCSRDANHDRGMGNFVAISRTSSSESSTFWQGTLRQHGGQLLWCSLPFRTALPSATTTQHFTSSGSKPCALRMKWSSADFPGKIFAALQTPGGQFTAFFRQGHVRPLHTRNSKVFIWKSDIYTYTTDLQSCTFMP